MSGVRVYGEAGGGRVRVYTRRVYSYFIVQVITRTHQKQPKSHSNSIYEYLRSLLVRSTSSLVHGSLCIRVLLCIVYCVLCIVYSIVA